jgi:hypothetical protein
MVVPIPISVMMIMAAFDVDMGAVMVFTIGMSVGWLVMVVIAITIMVSADTNRHTTRTYVNMLGHRGRRVCDQ